MIENEKRGSNKILKKAASWRVLEDKMREDIKPSRCKQMGYLDELFENKKLSLHGINRALRDLKSD